MFCTSCGTQMPDQAKFCTTCGARIGQPDAPAAQVPQTPPAAPAPSYTAPVGYVKKGKFLRSYAGKKTKLLSLTALIVMLASIASVVVCGVNFLNGDVRDIPVMPEKVDESVEELQEMVQEAEEYDAEEFADELIDSGVLEESAEEDIRAAKKLLKAAKSLARTPSIMNIKNTLQYISFLENMDDEISESVDMGDSAEDMLKIIGVSDLADMGDSAKDMLKIMGIFNVLIIGVCIYFAVVALFALLGGLRKSLGWAISAIMFALPLTAMVSAALAGLVIVLLIAQVVLNAMIGRDYKNFQKGTYVPA